ncbi:hypothetical protein [Corynebacterium kalidii]|uniref:Uncharacterized protein n=1 Tax=Corynebacterium kalidii TaxID=2931982 RepID=A0A9X1WF05_9CORY|nr:hypothetical protein [Corynebacterium kalidii]MCJ7857784.1 hypothetical protein [Corynebacterium kalidii]
MSCTARTSCRDSPSTPAVNQVCRRRRTDVRHCAAATVTGTTASPGTTVSGKTGSTSFGHARTTGRAGVDDATAVVPDPQGDERRECSSTGAESAQYGRPWMARAAHPPTIAPGFSAAWARARLTMSCLNTPGSSP